MTRRRPSALCGGGLLWLACLPSGVGCMPAETLRPLSVWVVSGDHELTTDTPPNLENDVYSAARHEVLLRAAINETVAIQVGLRATAPPYGPLDVRLTDLSGSRGRLKADDVAAVYRVHYTRVDRVRSWYSAHTGKPATPGLFPDALVPWNAPRGGGPLILSEPRNEIAWVDLWIPPTTAPGEYRGRLEVCPAAAQRPLFACDVRIDVLPVAIPGRRALPVVCRVDPRDLLTQHLRWPRTTAEETRLLPSLPSHLAAVRLVQETMQLLQEHRVTPVLWASFPKFRPTGERSVEIDWSEYDQLVEGWLDGSRFRDGVRLEIWPIPASLDYPNAERNGGLDAPSYARLLASYLAECERHFAARGWLDRAVLRPAPPAALTHPAVERIARLGHILRQAETTIPLLAHLPARALRGLGWYDAPSIEPCATAVSIWVPPAMWYEPEAMTQLAGSNPAARRTGFLPDYPPYSGSLAVEAAPVDARVLPWQAHRYGASLLWVEHAAEFAPGTPESSAREPWAGRGLLYPADDYGFRDRPVASIRLKRLRRGLLDFELLRLLEANGKPLLARQLAEQVVRWACTDAAADSLATGRESGWARDPSFLRLARDLILQELAGEFDPQPAARQRQIAALSQWGLMMSSQQSLTTRVDGVRLTADAQGLRAAVLASVTNTSNRPVEGRWSLLDPLPDWRLAADVRTQLAPGTRRPVRVDLLFAGHSYNADGIYPFDLVFESPAIGRWPVPARLAVVACPLLESPPHIDGRLDDWPLATHNSAGDFRLCRENVAVPPDRSFIPTLPTRAFVGLDRDHLYIAVRCTLIPGEPPVWQADNAVTMDGAIPWGQDLVEVLIDPRGVPSGTSADLYCLQIKPTGLLVARKGCRTEPPMQSSDLWPCGARVAASVQRDAWIAELALPLAAFDAGARRNPIWGFNVTRLDARRGEYSSWSGARGYCYAPQSLGNLILLATPTQNPAARTGH